MVRTNKKTLLGHKEGLKGPLCSPYYSRQHDVMLMSAAKNQKSLTKKLFIFDEKNSNASQVRSYEFSCLEKHAIFFSKFMPKKGIKPKKQIPEPKLSKLDTFYMKMGILGCSELNGEVRLSPKCPEKKIPRCK